MPGSTTYARARFQKPSSFAVSANDTSRASPGASVTRRKPLSAQRGRATVKMSSRRYICTTSSPATVPVFVTRTVTTFPFSTGFDTSNVVYESP